MQSGRSNLDRWVLEYKTHPKEINSIGWIGTKFPTQQIKLSFSTKERAIKYAEDNHINHIIISKSDDRLIKPKSYIDNFLK